MELRDWLTIAALIVGPTVAVLISLKMKARAQVRKLRFEEEMRALDEFCKALLMTEQACLETGKPQLNKEKVIRDANTSLVALAQQIDGLVQRLPTTFQDRATKTSNAIRKLTVELMPDLAAPPGQVNVRIAPKIAGFSNELQCARIEAEKDSISNV